VRVSNVVRPLTYINSYLYIRQWVRPTEVDRPIFKSMGERPVIVERAELLSFDG